MKKFISLLSIVVFILISCDDAEINIGEESLAENQSNFQVDYDNQTYTADYVQASIVSGVTVLKAYKASTKEYVVIVLNKDIESIRDIIARGEILSVVEKEIGSLE